MYVWTVEQLTQAVERCEKGIKAGEAELEAARAAAKGRKDDTALAMMAAKLEGKQRGLETLKRWMAEATPQSPAATAPLAGESLTPQSPAATAPLAGEPLREEAMRDAQA